MFGCAYKSSVGAQGGTDFGSLVVSMAQVARLNTLLQGRGLKRPEVLCVENFSNKKKDGTEWCSEEMCMPAEPKFRHKVIIKVAPKGRGMDDYGKNVTIFLELPQQDYTVHWPDGGLKLKVSILVFCGEKDDFEYEGTATIEACDNNDLRWLKYENRYFKFEPANSLSFCLAESCLVEDTFYFAVKDIEVV